MKRLIPNKLFEKQVKALKKKHYPLEEMSEVISLLANDEVLSGRYKDHVLQGEWKGYRECHIRSNWLLIYRLTDTELFLVATGTHDDLFK